MIWHTELERRLIRQFGGRPLEKYGYDGIIRGKPVEVRSVRKDNRFRIQKNVHKELIKRDGCYIFSNGSGRSKKVPATKVSSLIGRGSWFKDRRYPHKFLKEKDVF